MSYQSRNTNPRNPNPRNDNNHNHSYKPGNHQGNHQGNQQGNQQGMNNNPRMNRNSETHIETKPKDMSNKDDISIMGNILAKISFCDKQCSNINDNKIKAQIVKHLESAHDINVITRDYTIINPNNLRIVSYHQHLITPFTNGNPYFLYLSKIDGINCCIFIDKKLKDGYTFPKMHCVKYNFNNELFEKETVFSGELVKDNERRWFFLMDNIVLYKGMNTNEKNIISRYELIHSILEREYKVDKYLEICPLQVKRLFLYKDIRKMVEDFIPNLSYVCKGIVFYTLNNKCSNFAFILSRESQFEVKSPMEIDEIVQNKYPRLWEKKHSIVRENIQDALTIGTTISTTGSSNTTVGISCNSMNDKVVEPLSLEARLSDIVEIEVEHVVFKILKTDIPDIYNLYCINSNTSTRNIESDYDNIYKHSIALVPNIKTSHYLYNTFKSNPSNLTMKVEARFSKIFEKWIPIRFVGNEPNTKEYIEKIEDKLKN